jgi:hypothetical protein
MELREEGSTDRPDTYRLSRSEKKAMDSVMRLELREEGSTARLYVSGAFKISQANFWSRQKKGVVNSNKLQFTLVN